MSLSRTKQTARTPSRKPRKPAWKFVSLALIGAALLVLALVVIHTPFESPRELESPADSSATADRDRSAAKQVADRPDRPPKKITAKSSPPASTQGPVAAEKADPYGDSSPRSAGELMASLWDMLQGKGTVTPEMVHEIRRTLRLLVAQGEAAVPAIRQFLESGEDASLSGAIDTADHLKYDSLRLNLFDALRRIGGQEAEGVLLGQLQSTYGPQEIGTLAKFLDELAPGYYRQEAVEAARETMALSSERALEARDVGTLFSVLQANGDYTVVADLEENSEQWGYYATVALAGLHGGEGIPTLIDMVNELPESRTSDRPVQSTDIYADKNLFALQMLAQVAIQHPNAQEALLEQAGLDRIPDSLWPNIALALAGQYQFQNEKPDDSDRSPQASNTSPRVKAAPHIIVENDQVIYIANRYGTAKLPPEEVEARLGLIDELLSVSASPAAVRALNRARSLLTASKK